MRLTNGHSAAPTCTPSRYALFTGRYAWGEPGTNILAGDANLIIKPGSATLLSLLKQAGYTTAAIGKWHLGLGNQKIDWNQEIRPGPLETGFDEAFFLPATGDRVPTVLIENRRVAGLDPAQPLEVSYRQNFPGQPTDEENPELLKMRHGHGQNQSVHNGIGRIGYQRGGDAARWIDEHLADIFTARAVKFIESTSKDRPFFLYFATHDIHVPRVPHPRFSGKSGMGPRGDALLEFDWSVGEIAATLDRLGLAENTLLIITSDNGPVLDDGYIDQAREKNGSHRPAGNWRGGKGSAFEGGTRVPFILRWPARIKPGVSDALIGQVDLFASFAALTGSTLGADDAPDSFNLLPALLAETDSGRDHLIQQGGPLSITRGHLKYIQPTKEPNPPKISTNTGIETGRNGVPQLYDLQADPGETKNLADQRPGDVKELAGLLDRLRTSGRSRP